MATRIREKKQRPGAAQPSPLVIERLDRPGPWEAYSIALGGFAATGAVLAGLRKLIGPLIDGLAADRPIQQHVFFQVNSLHIDGANNIVSQNGRDWIPAIGLGVPPMGPAPREWNNVDFEQLLPGQAPPQLIHPLLHVSKGENSAAARETMLGKGALIEIAGPHEAQATLASAREALISNVPDPNYHAYPFFAPLLDARALTQAAAGELERWTGGGRFYMRECLDDNAVVFASAEPLGARLEGLGCRPDAAGARWSLPE